MALLRRFPILDCLLTVSLLTLTSLTITSSAYSQENVIHIAGGSKYVCLDEKFPARVVESNSYRKISKDRLKKIFAQLRNQIANLKRKIARAENQADANLINSLETQLAIAIETRLGLQACKKGELINSCKVIGDGGGLASAQGTRIINGELCPIGDSPAVQIQINFPNTVQHCSGFLASQWVAITAAHCFYNSDGEDSAESVRVTTAFEDIEAYSWDHPTYIFEESVYRQDDYAFILLRSAASQSRVFPIVSTGEGVMPGEPVVFGGYGKDEEGFSGFLETGSNIASTREGGVISFVYSDNPLQANTCKGDSGGPLLVKRGDVWKVAGITSAGTKTDCSVGDISSFADLDQQAFQAALEDYLSYTGFN